MLSNALLVQEVLHRGEMRQFKKSVILKSAWMSTLFACLMVALLVYLDIPSLTPENTMAYSPYGTLVFAGSAMGGYVLVGILAMTLGVIVTLLCLKLAEKKREKENQP